MHPETIEFLQTRRVVRETSVVWMEKQAHTGIEMGVCILSEIVYVSMMFGMLLYQQCVDGCHLRL